MMFDDGLHNDGIAGDGIFGATMPTQANGTIIEFYVEARDAQNNVRTWPAPAVQPDGSLGQAANALYQVDDNLAPPSISTTNQPMYRLIMTGTERNYYSTLAGNSDAEMNGTFISTDADGVKVRYNAGIRTRGAGSRSRTPHSLRVNIPTDRRWNGLAEVDLKTQFIHAQLAGHALAAKAGLPAGEARAIQLRVNGLNWAPSGAPVNGGSQGAGWGACLFVEPYNGDWSERLLPHNAGGNIYRGSKYPWTANLDYLGTNYLTYINAGYAKSSNHGENDWSDMFRLTWILNQITDDAEYVQAVRTNVNVELWMRYFALCNFINYNESSMCNGIGDDYALYRGIADPRFILLVHDFDTILGEGDNDRMPSPTTSIWRMVDSPRSTNPSERANYLPRLMRHPEFAPVYLREMKRLCDTIFSAEQFNPFLDQLLSGWVDESTILTLKNFVAARRINVLSQIPQRLSGGTGLTFYRGYPHATTPEVMVYGQADVLKTYTVQVNGTPASYSPWNGRWTNSVTLQPGLNRVLVQAFDANNLEFARTIVDVWYDTGASAGAAVAGSIPTNTTWLALNGPYRVTNNLIIPAGTTLTIEPGVTVYLSPGNNLTISNGGCLLAEGNATTPIRFTRDPESAANWGGITIYGGTNSPETRLAFAHIEFNGATAIHSVGGTLFLDHLTFGATDRQYLSLDGSSFLVSDCVFLSATAYFELVHGGGGIKTGGRGIFLRNFFGAALSTSGNYNDVVDFTGGSRLGPIVQFINNVFVGASDDHLDLDSTDAWIEGNIFLHAHKNGSPDTSSAISGGNDTGQPSRITAIGNLIYDCDHAALAKQGNFYTFLNNTIVNQTHQGGLDTAGAVICLQDNNMTEGAGAYFEGNIIYNAEQLTRDRVNALVTFTNNLMALSWNGPGGGNSAADPLFQHVPQLRETTNFTSWAQAQVMREWLSLRAGSPGRDAGPNGTAIGAIPIASPRMIGVSISGESRGTNSQNTATLLVGVNRTGNGIMPDGWPDGAGYTHYRWRLDGGAWSAETPIATTITLTGLGNGPHYVEAVGRRDAGMYQNDAAYGADAVVTRSRTWVVDSNLRWLRLNEVLASNRAAVEHEGTYPDLVELFNAGAAAVDLSGMGLTDNRSQPFKFVFPAGAILQAGRYLVLFADNNFSASGLHLDFALAQAGGGIYLFNPTGQLLDALEYGSQLTDCSLGRLDDGTWGLSYPTFGAANRRHPTGDPQFLRLSEWLADGETFFPDDFLEIVNLDPAPVDLGGCFLTDNPIGWPSRHKIPPLTFIAANSYFTFTADGQTNLGREHLNFQLRSEQGLIGLFDPATNLIDSVYYEPQHPDISQGRSLSSSNAIAFFSVPTPGGANPVTGGAVTISNAVVTLLPMISYWRYERNGLDLGTAWRQTNYNDSAWPNGLALLGVESSILAYPLNTQFPNYSDTQPTYYFRTTFVAPTNLVGAVSMTTMLDDGAVIYLNGNELRRIRMPDGAITYYTSALAPSVGDASTETFPLEPALIRPGTNYLAVEVHQVVDPNSSDVVWGMSLQAIQAVTNINQTTLFLNELLANNQTVTNQDGAVTDWVELYNPGDTTRDLSGLSLTDNSNNPRRWVFPAGVTIPARDYLVVQMDPNLPPSTNATFPLNTGFGLKASGDQLFLYERDTTGGTPTQIDSFAFGLQAADFSLGRAPDGLGAWMLCLPSLGARNLAVTLGNPAALKINEWMANPLTGDDWFELFNPGNQPVAIGNLYLTDDLNRRTQYRIPPHSYMGYGGRGFARFVADNNPGAGADHTNFRLDKDGESIGIFSSVGAPIDTVTFGLQAEGVAEGRLLDGATNIVRFLNSASPGNANYLPLRQVVISEALAHSDPPFQDAIELRNLSDQYVDLSGWWLSDEADELKKFPIPNGTLISPQGSLVFYEYQFNPPPYFWPAFALSGANGDQIYLSQADPTTGALTGQRMVVTFGPSESGVSLGRYETSVGPDFAAMSQRTFGADNPVTTNDFIQGAGLPNAYPLVGPIVITEIMYHPPDLGANDNTLHEYIELYNLTAQPVPLFHTNAPERTWHLRDGVDFDFPTNVTLPAHGYLLVVNFNPANTNALADFRARYGLDTNVPVFGPYQGKLANDGEGINLNKPDDLTPEGDTPYVRVERVRYFDSIPWPAAADGNTNFPTGVSLQRRIADAYGNDPVNWIAARPTPAQATGPAILIPPAITSLTPPQFVNAGTNLTLTVSATGAGPLVYQWRFNDDVIPGATNNWLALTNVQAANVGPYTVLVGNPAGAASAGTRVEVDLRLPPSIARQPDNKYAAAGGVAFFSAWVLGSPPLDYQWYKDGSKLVNGTNALLRITNVQFADEGSYFVTVTNAYGAVTSSMAALVIQIPPFISTQPQGANLYVGEMASFIAAVGGSEPLRCQWRLNDVNMDGATNTTLILNNVQMAQAGRYTLFVSNAVGSVISTVAVLTVTAPPIMTVQAISPLAEEDGAAPGAFLISRAGSTSLPLTIYFEVAGTAVPGTNYLAFSSPLTIPAGSNSITVMVMPIENSIKEPDTTVILNLIAARGYALGSPSNATVTVIDDDNLHPTVAITNPTSGLTFTGPTNIVITAVASDSDGTVVQVEFYANATNKLGVATSGTSAFAITWGDVPRGHYSLIAVAVDDLGARTVSPPVPINVITPQVGFADLFEERGLISGATNTVLGTNSTFTSEPDEPNHDGKSGSHSGWLTWTAPAHGLCTMDTIGSSFDTVLAVYTNNPPAVQVLSNIVRVASNDNADNSRIQSKVTFAAVAGVTYQIAVDGVDSAASGAIAFHLNLPIIDPGILAQPRNLAVIQGDNAVFAVGPAGYEPFSYQWQFNRTNLAGATNSSLALPAVQPVNAGNYRVVVRNASGSITSAEATLTVLPAPAIKITRQPQGQSVQSGAAVAFDVSAEGAPPLHYQWRLYGTNLPQATNSTLALTDAALVDGGPYQVVISNAAGTVISDAAVLLVDEDLIFRISALQSYGATVVDTYQMTSFFNNGVAVSPTRVFVTGYNGTGSYDAGNQSGGRQVSTTTYFGMVCNLRTEQIYSLGYDNDMINYGGTVNSLIELDGVSGLPTGNRIVLSSSLYASGGGVFSGYDRIVIWTGSRVYNIALPTGVVTDLGPLGYFERIYGNGWAIWGLAEYWGGAIYLVYAQNSTTIARIRVGPNAVASPVSRFSNLGSYMANVGFSISRSRWYFRYYGDSQFGNYNSCIGSAKGSYSRGAAPPAIYLEPQPQLSYPDSNVTFQVIASGLAPMNYQWQFNGTNIAGADNPTLQLSMVQPDNAGEYSVIVSNNAGTVKSVAASLYIVSKPEILWQPTPRSVTSGSNTTFTVGCRAASPFFYQWRLNGTNLVGATNDTLSLTNISRLDIGLYSVAISNRFGVTVSSNAMLAMVVDTGFSFRILSLGRTATLVDHQEVTMGDYGGLAVGENSVLYNGTGGAGRFSAANLAGGTALGRQYHALVSDLRQQKVYSLAYATNLLGSYGGTVDNLQEIDADTGVITPNRINLTQSIYVGAGSGLFAGYGQIVILTSSRAYAIAVPSGVVQDCGYMSLPNHQDTPTWAFWGVAENFGGSTYLVYVQNANSIVRTRVPDGITTTVANFVDLGNMACLSVSIPRGRWYFHYANQAEFGGANQTLGFCPATFEVRASQVVDHFGWGPIAPAQLVNEPIPVTLTALNVLENPVTNFTGPATLFGFDADTGQVLPVTPAVASGFSNGVWAGAVVFSQPGDHVYLRAQDASTHLGNSGQFSVSVPNDLKVTMTVQPTQATVRVPLTYTILVTNSGPLASTGVMLTNSLPPEATFVSATASQGVITNLGGKLIWAIGTLGPNVTATITLTLVPETLGSLTNAASVSRLESDLRPENNTAILVTPVTPPWLAVDDLTLLEGSSGYTKFWFTVTLSASNAQPVWVDFTTTNGTAIDNGDYQKRSGTLFFPPGVTSATTNVNVIGETFFELDESFYVILRNPTNAVIGKGLGVMTILNDDPAPAMTTLDAAFSEGNTGAKTIWVSNQLTRPSSIPVSVSFATADGTAKAGQDYVATNGALAFPLNATNLTLYLSVLGNTRGEPAKTFFINLFNPVNTTLLRTQAVVTILNDDSLGALDHFEWSGVPSNALLNTPFPVTVTARDFNGNVVSNFSGRVSLNGIGGGGIQNLTLGAGNSTWNWPISTFYHDARCSSIYLASELGGPRVIYGLALNVTSLSAGTVNQTMNRWTIRMKHTTRASFTDTDDWDNLGWTQVYQNSETLRSTGWVNFTFSAPYAYNGVDNLLVDFSFDNDSYTTDGYVATTSYSQNRSMYFRCDSCVSGGPLQWTRANTYGFNVGQMVPNIRLVLSGGLRVSPTASDFFTNGVWNGAMRVLELASDCQLTASDASQHAGVSRYFDVLPANDLALSVLTSANPTPVGELLVYSVVVSNSGPTDFHDVLLTNRFPGNAEFINLLADHGSYAVVDNAYVLNQIEILEANESASLIVWIRPTNATFLTNIAGVTRTETEFYTVNNFVTNVTRALPLELSVSDISLKEGDSGFTNAVFNVSLSASSTQTVSVAFFTADGTANAGRDYQATNGTLVFPPGATNCRVVVPVIGDLINESNEDFYLNLLPAANVPSTRSNAVCVILNDDPRPIISINDVTIAEGNSGFTPADLTLTLSAPSQQQIDVYFNTRDGSARSGFDYLSTNGFVSFPPGATSANLRVLVRGDTVAETDRTFYVSLSGPTGATLGVVESQVTVLNDDGVAGQVSRFDWAPVASPQNQHRSFSVTITARDAQNAIATNFNSAVALYAMMSSLTNSVILGNVTFPSSVTNQLTLGYSFMPSVNLTVTHFRHYSGTKVSLWTDTGELLASKEVAGPDGVWQETLLDTPLLLRAGIVYRVGVFNGAQNHYYNETGPDAFSHGVLGQCYYGNGDGFPANSVALHSVGVDLRFTAPTPPVVLSMTPSQTTPFVNGLWSGEITVTETATNVQLVAEAGSASGASNPFEVQVLQADVAVNSTMPPSVVAGKTITLTLNVYNRGPASTGLLLTNLLPENLIFLSASASQGSWTNRGQGLIFDLGTLTNRGRALIAIMAQTVFPATDTNLAVVLTNLVTVTPDIPDPYLANNQTRSIITLLADTDQDGLPDGWELAHGLDRFNPLDANADADQDSLTNLQEYLIGTDPQDPLSMARITAAEINGADMRLSFPTVPSRHYELQTTTNLFAEPVIWIPVQSDLAGDGETKTLVHPGAANQSVRYYRLLVRP